ncbi:MAG: response regulator [Acidipila sp.]|nr:response regulator [Acidipila sp.]
MKWVMKKQRIVVYIVVLIFLIFGFVERRSFKKLDDATHSILGERSTRADIELRNTERTTSLAMFLLFLLVVILIVSANRNLYACEQAECAEKSARVYAENLFNTMREPLLVLGPDLRVRTANRAFYRNFQLTPEVTLRRFVYEIGDGQWNIARLRSLLEENLPTNECSEDFEVIQQMPKLGQRTMFINARKVDRFGHDSGSIVCAIEDITERKKTEAAMRDQSEIIESILEHIGDGVVVADLQGRFLRFNQAAEHILGVQRLDIPVEQWSTKYRLFLPDQVTPLPTESIPLTRAMRGEEVTDFEFFVRRQNHQLGIFCSATARPLRDAQGNLRGGVVVFRNISHSKRTEAELVGAKDEAERANKCKDQFLSTMSHELRTPLTAILGFSELLSDQRYGTLNARQERYLRNIQIGGKHLLKLINDILDLSKIAAGHLELARESVAVDAAVNEVLTALQPLADNKSQHFSPEIQKHIAVWADATRFQQVLMNLLGNAIKFTPNSGRIRISARLVGERVRVEIQDSGPGIAPEQQKRIFEAFYRLQSGQAPEGTGLGLAITQRLVELQGGILGLESELGKGCCFFFELPAGSRVPISPAKETSTPTATKPMRILVIDDEPVAAQLIRSYLTSAGYEVDVCDQPEVATELASRLQPDAVTLELQMKPINGWEILLQLKRNPRTALIPVVVVSVVDQPGIGAALGADAYLVKPVEMDKLAGAIRRCLGGIVRPPLNRSVLVVEDDTVTLEVICKLLRSQGYSVTTARDGAEARKAVQEFLPELVILDLLLPETGGLELLAEWRAHSRTADLPVFVLTNKDITSEEEKYLRTQVDALLHKKQPWKEDLLNQVKKALGSPQLENA